MSSTSSQLGNGTENNLRKCKTCKELRPEEKFKTNGYDKDGNRTRMATCRSCMESSKTAALLGGNGGDTNVRLEKVQVVGRAFDSLTKVMTQL